MLEQNVIYQVSGADLMAFAQELINETQRTTEAQMEAQRSESYLSPEQVCKMLDVDLSTLWRWNKRGYLCHTKMGAKNRYKRSEVIKLVEGGK